VLVPTALDPSAVDRFIQKADGGKGIALARLRELAAALPDADWEKELVAALGTPISVRTALVNEQLTELDYRIKRWVRVPRVCASICSSSGFLLAAIVLRATLADGGDAMDGGFVDAAVFRAIDIAAVGLAGAAFCISIQMRARLAAASRAEAYDRMVQRLERIAADPSRGAGESSDVCTA
jgi:hypothetical protein